MRLVAYFTGLLVLLLSSQAAFSADYYVAGNGNDSNPGTVNAPWRTIAKANKTLSAGDTVFIRGGEYREAVAPGASGKPSAPIRYQAYQDEKIVLTSPPPDAQGKKTAIRLEGRSYIVVEGLKVDGKRISKSGKESDVDHFIRFNNAHYNEINNCTFQYANGFAGVHISGGSSYNRFTNNVFDAVGTNHIPAGYPNAGEDRGDTFVIKNASHNVLETNRFTRGGHNSLDVIGSYNVVRANTFDGTWTGTDSPGARAVGALSANVKYGVPDPRGYNLFEFNIAKNTGASVDNDVNPAMKVQGYNQIVRGNYFYDNVAAAVSGSTRVGSTERVQHSRIYNNTLYNTDSLFWYQDYGNNLPFNDNIFKNNLIASIKNDLQVVTNFTTLATTYGSITDEIDGMTIAGNIFEAAGGKEARMKVKVSGVFIAGDFAWMQKRYPKNIYSNRTAKMAFRDAAARSPAGFDALPGSPAIDSGLALTETLASGSGKVIRVRDARYFYDGFGIPGESGDMIVVGNSAPIRITSIDYGRNELSVATATNWTAAAPVNLAYSGTAPDVGAHELYAQYGDKSSSSAKPRPPQIQLSSN